MHADSSTNTQHRFARRLGAGTASISSARQAFDTWLREATDDEEILQEMSIVVSELASNALDGADPAQPDADVRAEVARDVLEVVVSNRTPADLTDIRRWDLDDTLRGGGRGLMIVRAYTDTLVVDSTGDTVRVRCTRRLHEPA